MLEDMISQLGNGLALGSIIAITAAGLSVLYGVTRIVNFAHGELVTLGAVIALWLASPPDRVGSGRDLPFLLAVIITIAVGIALGTALERLLFRPLRERRVGTVAVLVITIGLAFVIRHLIVIWIGSETYSYPLPLEMKQDYLGVFRMTPREAAVVVLTIIILTAVGLFITRTRLGTAMRALADNADLAESSGINTNRIILVAVLLSVSLAFVGGIFFGVADTVRWNSGLSLLLLMFAAVILGGIGNPFGAMLGGYLIGFLVQLSIAIPILSGHNELRFAVALGVMLLVLLFRPQGILGSKERVS